MAEKKTTIIGKDTFETLEDVFDAIAKGQKKALQQLKEGQKEIAAAQEKELKRAIKNVLKEWATEESALTKAQVQDLEAYKRKFLEDRIDEERKKRLELVNSIYKKEVELNTKAGKKRRNEELVAQRELNEAWLKKYEEIEKSGGSLTAEQKADRAQKEQEVREAKQYQLQEKMLEVAKAQLNAINNGISTYAKYQGEINARLQGSNLGGSGLTVAERLRYGENTFGILENRLALAVGIQPYVRTEDMLSSLETLVKAGIAANVEQRAFLQTVKENIADTFDAANSSLLRIVRLQQSDSTAARLGMEAYLTRFLNQMVENTEYLNQTFDTVQEALIEASSQMTMEASTEFEYVVQKWLGALTGTGLSEATAQGIAQALGYIGSGNVSAFGSSAMQGLLTMAASRAGLDIGSLLESGLTAKSTNALLNAIANYMVEIGQTESNVVRAELAQAFGLNVSDIRAAQQLSGDFSAINKNLLSYSGMYGSLNQQMLALPGRLSMGEMIQNVFDNSLFSLASSIAENPALAALWKVTDLIQSTTGGINIPFISAMGSGMDLNATVEQLMKLGIVGVSSLGMIGDVISGLGSSLVPSSMLWKLGITSGNTAISRGSGLSSLLSGFNLSGSTFVGQGSGSDIYQQTLQQSSESAQQDNTLQPQTDKEQTEALPNIYQYLSVTFDKKFDDLMTAVNDLRNKVVDGEIEIVDSNHNAFIV